MDVRFPRFLVPGDRVGVTAPSAGVDDGMWPRLEVALDALRARGLEPVVGACIRTPSHVSGSREARADELMAMLVDPDIAAVVPPWGGEMAIDVLPLLDFDLLADCDPCWYVGFSDTTTTMLPLTLRSGWATLHGWNLMDTPFAAAAGPPALARCRDRDGGGGVPSGGGDPSPGARPGRLPRHAGPHGDGPDRAHPVARAPRER